MEKNSIKDIANRLGLSKGTVSLVLNGKAKEGRISEAVCKKVLKTADEMCYRPNEIARSLSTGKTMSIGIVITDISNDFFGYLTFYIQEEAKKYGYSVIIANSNENLKDFSNAIVMLLSRQVDGIIFVPVDGGEKIAKEIVDRGVPLVQVDRYYSNIRANYVVVNNYESSVRAVELLIKKGCRKIAVICYDLEQNALIERKRGYTDALSRYGLLDETLIKDIEYVNQEEDIRRAIVDLKSRREKVDAIFFCSRRVFTIGLKYIYEEGIRVPEDMMLLCFDKAESFSIVNMSFNYIEQPIKEMGTRVVDILMDQINNESEEVKCCVLDTKICFS